MKFSKNTTAIFLMILFSGVMVVAQSLGSVKGRVRAGSGSSIADVKITARQNGNDMKSVKTDGKGKFRINGLAPGKYNLLFEKDGYSSGVLYDVLIKKKKVNNLKDRLVLTVDQGTLVIVSGSVFNQFGRSVYGAKVTIEEIRPNKPNRKAGTFYSSLSGHFIFRFRKGKKKFRIIASTKNVSSSKEIEVEEAGIYRLAITLNLPEKRMKNKKEATVPLTLLLCSVNRF